MEKKAPNLERISLFHRVRAEQAADLLQFSICLKLLPKIWLICIVSTMFQIFSNIVKNIEVKIASLRIGIHHIVKKSEHPPAPPYTTRDVRPAPSRGFSPLQKKGSLSAQTEILSPLLIAQHPPKLINFLLFPTYRQFLNANVFWPFLHCKTTIFGPPCFQKFFLILYHITKLQYEIPRTHKSVSKYPP